MKTLDCEEYIQNHYEYWHIHCTCMCILSYVLVSQVFWGCNYLFSTFKKIEICCTVIKFSRCEFSILEKRDRRKRGESQQKNPENTIIYTGLFIIFFFECPCMQISPNLRYVDPKFLVELQIRSTATFNIKNFNL